MSIEFRLTEKGKRQAVLLLITLIGLLFSIIPLKYNTPFNIFIPGIFLLISPVIYLLIWNNETITRRDEIFIFTLIMLTVFLNHYIFALRFNYPIGTDVSSTLSTTCSFLSDTGKIDFSRLTGPSRGFVGLYILYTILPNITGTDINILAAYLPPVINMVVFVFFYFFIRKFFEPGISLLSVFVCGWEHTVFKFGFEYRTQSLAIVLYMAILALIAFNTKPLKSADNTYLNKKEQESIKYYGSDIKIIILILVSIAAITTMHFLTICVLNIALLGIYFSYLIAHNIKWKVDLKISVTLTVLSFVLFIGYMMYLGQFFGGVLEFVRSSMTESLSSEPFGPTSSAQGLKAYLYGPFVFWVTWLIRFVFIGSCIIFFQKQLREKKRTSDLFILSWMGVLLLFMLSISVWGYELNPGRLYNFFAFPFSIIISFGLLYVVRNRGPLPKSSIKLLLTIFLILFVISSLLKLPNSIIGNTEPFRGYQPVDDVHWERGMDTDTDTDRINTIQGSENEVPIYSKITGFADLLGKNKTYSNGGSEIYR